MLPLGATPVAAQAWDAPEAVALQARGAAHRAAEAGPAARGWRARADGRVQWLLQLDPDGTPSAPRLVTTDSVTVEVYGRGAGRSKQFLRDWRRGRALPADITFHRDHLGIVTDGFGDRIRLGDGDEVQDVPHPLGPDGAARYAVALGDSLQVSGPAGTLRLRELLVRPRDPAEPAVVGLLLLDVERGALVRFVFGFTPAAYRDRTVEQISVVLESARDGDLWLPRHQLLEIRRRATRADLAVRTLIRAEWRISAVPDDTLPDSLFAGPPIAGPARPRAVPLPPADPRSDDPATAVRDLTRRLGGARLADARQGARLAARGASSILRVDRVQGVVLGAGAGTGLGGGVRLELDGALATATGRPAGGVQLAGPLGAGRWTLAAGRRVRDVADRPVIAPALNSLRTLVANDDAGDWAEVASVRGGLVFGPAGRARLRLGLESARALPAVAPLLGGQSRPNPALGQAATVVFGAEWRASRFVVDGEVGRGGGRSYGRVVADVNAIRTGRLGGELRADLGFGLASSGTPDRRGFVLGGRGTLVGTAYRGWDGFGMVTGRVEWLAVVPVPALRVRGPVTTGDRLRLGPFVAAGATWRDVPALPGVSTSGVRPVAGLVAEPLWGLLRVEVGVPLRGPGAGRPGVVVDVHPDWWPLL